MVNIGSVTAKIFLIWTNVTRTKVTGEDHNASDNLIFVSKGNIQNLIPLLHLLAVEKFLWWFRTILTTHHLASNNKTYSKLETLLAV